MRKEDKLRPYRVDYFNITEMKDNDLALVRSQIVRAVTAEESEYELLEQPEFWNGGSYPSLVVIRAHRYYKKLVHKRDVYKAVEDLFTANKAVKVMEYVEAYRAKQVNDLGNTPAAQAQMDALADQADAAGHTTRFSDSSLYDEVCTTCGATDANGGLNQPCTAATMKVVAPTSRQLLAEVGKHPNGSPEQKTAIIEYLKALDAEPTLDAITENLKALDAEPLEVITECLKVLTAPTTGPESPATIAVVADLKGMIDHDTHEQAMDTFVPTGVPEGKRFPDPTNAPITLTPVPMEQHDMLNPVVPNCPECDTVTVQRAPTSWTMGLGDPVVETPIEPDKAVGSEGRPPLVAPAHDAGEGDSLLLKVAAFATITLLVITGILYLLHR